MSYEYSEYVNLTESEIEYLESIDDVYYEWDDEYYFETDDGDADKYDE